MDAAQSLACYNHGYQNASYFSANTFSKLKDIMYNKELQKGERLFLEGDKANKLYYIKRGVVKLSKTVDDGKELVLYYFRQGDLFGELEGFNGEKCSLSAEVVLPSSIGVIRQDDLEILLKLQGELAVEFIKWLAQLQRFTQFKLRDLLFYGKIGALASTLIRMVNTCGIKDNGRIRFSVHFTNTELANMIGASRETVNRMLQQFKQNNVIDYDEGSLIILDLIYLKEICHCEGCPLEICRL